MLARMLRATPLDQPNVAKAVAASALACLPAEALIPLLEDAVLLEVPAGAVVQRQGSGPAPTLLVSGLIRLFHTAFDGRQVTVRYARAGELVEIRTIYLGRSDWLGQQALTACRLLRFSPRRLLEAAERDARVANILARELSRRLIDALEQLTNNTFASMRQRLVQQLLDLAAGPARRTEPPLIAHVTQQDLADAVGSVREVVVRVLRGLRADGLVRTGRDEIELLDVDRLRAETLPKSGSYAQEQMFHIGGAPVADRDARAQ